MSQKSEAPSNGMKYWHHRGPLFQHELHPHKPMNVNFIFEAEKACGNFSQKVALRLTTIFQAMPTFWVIIAWITLWIVANATIIHFDPLPWPTLLALTSVPQLPLMVVIMVGQGLLGRQQELQATEQYNTTIKTYHDIEQVMAHLSAQDDEIMRQTHMITHLLNAAGVPPEQFIPAPSPTNGSTTPPAVSETSAAPTETPS